MRELNEDERRQYDRDFYWLKYICKAVLVLWSIIGIFTDKPQPSLLIPPLLLIAWQIAELRNENH